MPYKDLLSPDPDTRPELAQRIWSMVDRLDQILIELDELNMPLPALHISLGAELLRQIRSSRPKR